MIFAYIYSYKCLLGGGVKEPQLVLLTNGSRRLLVQVGPTRRSAASAQPAAGSGDAAAAAGILGAAAAEGDGWAGGAFPGVRRAVLHGGEDSRDGVHREHAAGHEGGRAGRYDEQPCSDFQVGFARWGEVRDQGGGSGRKEAVGGGGGVAAAPPPVR